MTNPTLTRSAVAWAPDGLQLKRVFAALVLLLIAIAVLLLVGLGSHTDAFLANDFFAFNSFARFVARYPAQLIYDNHLLGQFQSTSEPKLFAFFYHPGMLLLVWPLAHVPYVAGYVGWIALGLFVYLAAVCGGDRWSSVAAVVAPSTIWTVICGQSSMIVAALLVGGLKLSRSRPVLGGLLLGLATYKPQLGVLVPFALLASRQWLTIATACLTFCCVVAVSSMMFGPAVWLSWLQHFPGIMHTAQKDSEGWKGVMVMVSSNLMMLGLSPGLAHALQLVASVVTAAFVYRCFRSGTGNLQIAVLASATFLATPFAFNYDLPLFTASVILFVNERRVRGDPFRFAEVMVVVASMMLPYCVKTPWLHCFSSVVVAAMVATITVRIRALVDDRATNTASIATGARGARLLAASP